MRSLAHVGTAISLCALIAGCPDEVREDPSGCHRSGARIAIGTTFDEGCNSCVCGADERITCTPTDACVVCTHEGEGYRVGESYPAGDGCNLCQCLASGQSECTTAACGAQCTYIGVTRSVGESFPSIDGCNSCTCGSNGSVACTKLACPCDPPSEWWRAYEATDPQTCTVIDFECPANTTPFENDCGCGCEQSHACAPSYDCTQGGCDPSAIAAQCPYSEILE